MTLNEQPPLDADRWDDAAYRDELLLRVLPECLWDDASGDYSTPEEANKRAEDFVAEAMRRRAARRKKRQTDATGADDSPSFIGAAIHRIDGEERRRRRDARPDAVAARQQRRHPSWTPRQGPKPSPCPGRKRSTRFSATGNGTRRSVVRSR
jgi:hypothetical protein